MSGRPCSVDVLRVTQGRRPTRLLRQVLCVPFSRRDWRRRRPFLVGTYDSVSFGPDGSTRGRPGVSCGVTFWWQWTVPRPPTVDGVQGLRFVCRPNWASSPRHYAVGPWSFSRQQVRGRQVVGARPESEDRKTHSVTGRLLRGTSRTHRRTEEGN